MSTAGEQLITRMRQNLCLLSTKALYPRPFTKAVRIDRLGWGKNLCFGVPALTSPRTPGEDWPLEEGFRRIGSQSRGSAFQVHPTHRPLSSSFLGLPHRILGINHKRNYLGTYG